MFRLRIQLLSSACFSSGKGFSGEVDLDIDYEEGLGLPCIRGRRLKGLLVETCAEILDGLSRSGDSDPWLGAAAHLFGQPGDSRCAGVHIDKAVLPESLRLAVRQALDTPGTPLTPHKVLQSLTEIRRQTMIDRVSFAPEPHSLRFTRLALPGLVFFSPLQLTRTLSIPEKALFAACALGLRRGGVHRNRGWGRLQARILNPAGTDETAQWVEPFLDILNNQPGSSNGTPGEVGPCRKEKKKKTKKKKK